MMAAKTFEECMTGLLDDLYHEMSEAEQEFHRKVWNAAVDACCETVRVGSPVYVVYAYDSDHDKHEVEAVRLDNSIVAMQAVKSEAK